MATRSTIAMKTKRGYRSIYCHFDGYPSGVGKTLKMHYQNKEKIKRLMKLGDISILAPEIGRKQEFNNPTKGWVLAYGRDMGMVDSSSKFSKTLDELTDYAYDCDSDYLYLFENNEWHTANLQEQSK